MKTKIKSVTIVCQQGIKEYLTGNEYSDLLLDRVEDHSQEFPDGWNNLLIGKTKDGATVFEAVNLPTDIQYCEDFVRPCPTCKKEWDHNKDEKCPHCGETIPF